MLCVHVYLHVLCVRTLVQRAHVVKSLKASGLVPVVVQSTCRDTPEVHVWIRCPVSRLEEEAEKTAVKKPLQEAGGLAAFAAAKRHLFEGPVGLHAYFSSAERQQLIYSIMTSSNALNGAALDLEKLKSQGYLIDAMPLHDNSHRQKLIDNWLNVSIFKVDAQPITDIKDYYGEELALYFAWAGHFVRCFIPLAFLGLVTQIAQNIIKYQNAWNNSEGVGRQVSSALNWITALYAFIMHMFIATYSYTWARRQYDLTHEWGVAGKLLGLHVCAQRLLGPVSSSR